MVGTGARWDMLGGAWDWARHRCVEAQTKVSLGAAWREQLLVSASPSRPPTFAERERAHGS